jgi:hypothetical protein
MQFLFFLFALLTSSTTKTEALLKHVDSCFSTQSVTVSYTLWIGTKVNENYTMDVTVYQYTTFYDVMKVAEKQDHQHYK